MSIEPRPVYIVDPPPPPPSLFARLWPLAVVVAILAVVVYGAMTHGGDEAAGQAVDPSARPSASRDAIALDAAVDRALASFQATIDAKDDECTAIEDPNEQDACNADVDALNAKLDTLTSCLEAAVAVDQVRSCQRSAGVTP